MSSAPVDPPVLDGRTARGLRTRRAVVDALLALQEEGDLTPTAQRVAERAGVALRTVFGHFSDMETLWAEAGARELEKLVSLAGPVDPALPLAERTAAFCASRARVLEALLPVMRAARLREHASPALTDNRRLFIEAGDEQVRRVFAPELAALGADAATTLHALYVVAAAAGWEGLRVDRGLDVAAATEVLRRTVTRLVDPTGGPL
ncbi:MAG: TetR family transcriptional regulator [Frankiales bacterium]|nr:TetR family transcriptional regulator [Frankiales bacterium]